MMPLEKLMTMLKLIKQDKNNKNENRTGIGSVLPWMVQKHQCVNISKLGCTGILQAINSQATK